MEIIFVWKKPNDISILQSSRKHMHKSLIIACFSYFICNWFTLLYCTSILFWINEVDAAIYQHSKFLFCQTFSMFIAFNHQSYGFSFFINEWWRIVLHDFPLNCLVEMEFQVAIFRINWQNKWMVLNCWTLVCYLNCLFSLKLNDLLFIKL